MAVDGEWSIEQGDDPEQEQCEQEALGQTVARGVDGNVAEAGRDAEREQKDELQDAPCAAGEVERRPGAKEAAGLLQLRGRQGVGGGIVRGFAEGLGFGGGRRCLSSSAQ